MNGFRKCCLLLITCLIQSSCIEEIKTKSGNQSKVMLSAQVTSSLTSASAQQILINNFESISLSNTPSPLLQLGVLLLQERVRLYGNQSIKLDAFAKGYGITLLTLQGFSLNSFSSIGLTNQQVIDNISFFLELENALLANSDFNSLTDSLRAPVLLMNILHISKFEPQVHEYPYLTEAVRSMLKSYSLQEIYTQSIPFAVYMRIIRTANYTVTPAEETSFMNYIAQEITNGVSPVEVGDLGIRSLILMRAIRQGYVALSPTYERDFEIISSMMGLRKTADQIVGELVNNVELSCSSASMKVGLPAKRSVATVKAVSTQNLLKKTFQRRKIANEDLSIKMNPLIVRKLKGKTDNKNSPILMKTRKVQVFKNKFKRKSSYVISIPKASFDKSIRDRMIFDIKKIAPKSRFLKTMNNGLNVILIDQLEVSDVEAILEHGYEVNENTPIVFQGQNTCPSSQYSVDVMTSSNAAEHIGAAALHAQGLRGQGVKIGIIDTGIEFSHSDFGCLRLNDPQCRLKVGAYSLGNENVSDPSGHGTHVTSIAAGNNGVAPGAQVIFYKVESYYDVLSIVSSSIAIDTPSVINMSFSFPENRSSQLSQLIDQLAQNHNVTVVAATGNCSLMRGSVDTGTCGGNEWDSQGIYSIPDAKKVIGSPGISKRAITVGVSDRHDNFASVIGLTGPQLDNTSLLKPDLVAPGRLICAAGAQMIEEAYGCGIYHPNRGGFFGWCDNSHAVLSGSSMSAPMVTGSVALLKQKYPHWSSDEIKSALRMTADDQTGNLASYGLFERGEGLVNVHKAGAIRGYPPVVRIDRLELQNNSAKNGFVITGAAYDRDGLAEYRVSIGRGDKPLSYTHLKSFSRSVGDIKTNEILMAFGEIPSCFTGKYIIKVDAVDLTGNIASDYAMINF